MDKDAIVAALPTTAVDQRVLVELVEEFASRRADLAEVAIKVPGESTALVQEGQFPTYHLLCKLIEAHVFPEMRV